MAPRPTESLDALRKSLQSAFDQPLSGLQQGLESLLEEQPAVPQDPLGQHLRLMIQVCSELRDLARQSLDLANPPADRAGSPSAGPN